MELWIRSQDRELLIKCDSVGLDLKSKSIEINFNDGVGFNIGSYKSKERALEVLDEIQAILRGKYAVSFDYKTSLYSFKKEDIEHMLEQMAVYEMPKE